MPWVVALSGHRFDLEELPDWLRRGGDFQVEEEDGQYLLTSDHFEQLDDPAAIRQSAEELVGVVNGLGRLQWSGYRPVTVSDISFIGADGKKSHHVVLASTAHLRDKVTTQIAKAGGGAPEESAEGSLVPWIEVAAEDERVQHVLAYLTGPDLTWNDLYRALEVVLSDVGGRIWEDGLASRSEVERFKRTANSFSVLGYAARHGRDRYEPPSAPLEFSAARTLVLGVVRAWLDEKADESRG